MGCDVSKFVNRVIHDYTDEEHRMKAETKDVFAGYKTNLRQPLNPGGEKSNDHKYLEPHDANEDRLRLISGTIDRDDNETEEERARKNWKKLKKSTLHYLAQREGGLIHDDDPYHESLDIPIRKSETSSITMDSSNNSYHASAHSKNNQRRKKHKPRPVNAFHYCMVFKAEKTNEGRDSAVLFSKEAQDILLKLKTNFELFAHRGVNSEYIFVLFKARLKRLREFAWNIGYSMELDPEELRKYLASGSWKNGKPNPAKSIEIFDDRKFCKYGPYDHIFIPYDPTLDRKLWLRKKEHDATSEFEFSSLDVLKLTALMMDNKENPIHLSTNIAKEYIIACFPLHDEGVIEDLSSQWYSTGMAIWNQDISVLRFYFGEKIGLYFRFVMHYSWWLQIPAFVGVPLQLYIVYRRDFSFPYLPIFAFLIAIWNVLMLEHWKRKENEQALEWGMVGFEDHEQDRPEWEPKFLPISPIDGSKQFKYFPSKTRTRRQYGSYTAVFIMMAASIGVVASIYIVRNVLKHSIGDYAQIVASVGNAIQIFIFNFLYEKAALYLNDQENHQKDHDYEDSLISKFFVFQFVNSYASFFYIAFIAPGSEEDGAQGKCGNEDCMETLAINLGIIFVVQIIVTNIVTYYIPYLRRVANYRETQLLFPNNEFSEQELQSFYVKSEGIVASIRNYTVVAIQFGYMSLFITALPVADVFGLICNGVSIRYEIWALMRVFQRPIPRGAEDIGTWQSIFTVIMVASVITNAGLAVYTMTSLHHLSIFYRICIFVAMQWFAFFLQIILMELVDDVPVHVVIQKQRQEFITKKVVEKVSNDDTDENGLTVFEEKLRKRESRAHKMPELVVHADFDTLVSEAHRILHSHVLARQGSDDVANEGASVSSTRMGRSGSTEMYLGNVNVDHPRYESPPGTPSRSKKSPSKNSSAAFEKKDGSPDASDSLEKEVQNMDLVFSS